MFEWSEVFYSIEGEGPYTGRPTVYVRFTKCNLECRGFNNPEGLDTTSIQTLGFDPKNYTELKSIPLITRGCDSIYSWDEKFKHLWKRGSADDLVEEILSVIPNRSFKTTSNKNIILSLTGGEPTLRAKYIPHLIKHPLLKDVDTVLIETNASVPLKDSFIDELHSWSGWDKRIVWSNSPKLPSSGEKWEKVINRSVLEKQENLIHSYSYLKFVCGPTEQDFNDVKRAVEILDPNNLNEVFIMPQACTEEQQQEVASKVALMCMERGYTYCHRVHNSVFGNGVGT